MQILTSFIFVCIITRVQFWIKMNVFQKCFFLNRTSKTAGNRFESRFWLIFADNRWTHSFFGETHFNGSSWQMILFTEEQEQKFTRGNPYYCCLILTAKLNCIYCEIRCALSQCVRMCWNNCENMSKPQINFQHKYDRVIALIDMDCKSRTTWRAITQLLILSVQVSTVRWKKNWIQTWKTNQSLLFSTMRGVVEGKTPTNSIEWELVLNLQYLLE